MLKRKAILCCTLFFSVFLLAMPVFAQGKKPERPTNTLVPIERWKEYLDAGGDINQIRTGQTGVYNTARNGKLEACHFLIEAGADVDIPETYFGNTPLMTAIECNYMEIARVLIQAGADVNKCNNRKVTPLMLAVHRDKYEMAKQLIEAGADVTSKDEHDFTALHYVPTGFLDIDAKCEMIKLLVEKGADIYAESDAGYTPLLRAIQTGEVGILEALFSGNPEVKPDVLISTIYAAPAEGQKKLLGFFIEKGADVNAKHEVSVKDMKGKLIREEKRLVLFEAVNRECWLEVIAYLLEKGADPNATFERSTYTLLLLAVERKDMKLCKMLVESGANPNSSGGGSYYQNPMYRAYDKKYLEILAYLLDNGGDANMQLGRDGTLLQQAMKANDLEMCKFLVMHGADVNQQLAGVSLLRKAASEGDKALCEFLVEHGVNMDGAVDAALLAGHTDVAKFLAEQRVLKTDNPKNNHPSCFSSVPRRCITPRCSARQKSWKMVLPRKRKM